MQKSNNTVMLQSTDIVFDFPVCYVFFSLQDVSSAFESSRFRKDSEKMSCVILNKKIEYKTEVR